ncbi:hypothetical protein AB0J68_20955 [Micromonospora sp. NPDC049580]|uniref:hypothetical protein n=1 Tax=Micromonospora sp. NPDC049580 TaxID=3154832 RepID=UPI003413A914
MTENHQRALRAASRGEVRGEKMIQPVPVPLLLPPLLLPGAGLTVGDGPLEVRIYVTRFGGRHPQARHLIHLGDLGDRLRQEMAVTLRHDRPVGSVLPVRQVRQVVEELLHERERPLLELHGRAVRGLLGRRHEPDLVQQRPHAEFRHVAGQSTVVVAVGSDRAVDDARLDQMPELVAQVNLDLLPGGEAPEETQTALRHRLVERDHRGHQVGLEPTARPWQRQFHPQQVRNDGVVRDSATAGNHLLFLDLGETEARVPLAHLVQGSEERARHHRGVRGRDQFVPFPTLRAEGYGHGNARRPS